MAICSRHVTTRTIGLTMNEANRSISKCVRCVCHDSLPWLIAVSLGL
jgi:hypothetical protein